MTTHEVKRLEDGGVRITLAGKIDEKFDPAPLVAQAPPGARVELYLAGVRAISSLGIRQFEALVSGLLAGRKVALVHVPPAIATQLTLIPNLCAGAEVQTAELPFLCPKCGHEQSALIPWRAGANISDAPACAACGAKMELDGMPEQYLPDR